jgi:hypothetical protein
MIYVNDVPVRSTSILLSVFDSIGVSDYYYDAAFFAVSFFIGGSFLRAYSSLLRKSVFIKRIHKHKKRRRKKFSLLNKMRFAFVAGFSKLPPYIEFSLSSMYGIYSYYPNVCDVPFVGDIQLLPIGHYYSYY